MRSIALCLLNVMFSFGKVVRNIKGGTEYFVHCSKFSDIDSTICFTFGLTMLVNTLLRRFNSFYDDGCID